MHLQWPGPRESQFLCSRLQSQRIGQKVGMSRNSSSLVGQRCRRCRLNDSYAKSRPTSCESIRSFEVSIKVLKTLSCCCRDKGKSSCNLGVPAYVSPFAVRLLDDDTFTSCVRMSCLESWAVYVSSTIAHPVGVWLAINNRTENRYGPLRADSHSLLDRSSHVCSSRS